MRITLYQPANAALWDAFVGAAKNGHFMHQRGYMEYHADRFEDHSLIAWDDSNAPIALLPANLKDHTLYSHQGLTFGGFIISTDMRQHEMLDLFAALKHYAVGKGFTKLVYKAMPGFYHQQPAQEDLYALFRMGASLVRADVSTTIDYTARVPFSTLRKRGAKKAEKLGITIRRSEDIAAFHTIIRGIVEGKYDTRATHSEAEMELLAARFPENIKLYAAYANDTILAGVLIFETATVAHAQYIGASHEGRNSGALDLLFLNLIETMYSAKHYFDFGISTEQGGTILNENLIAQKEGFGGRATIHLFYELNF